MNARTILLALAAMGTGFVLGATLARPSPRHDHRFWVTGVKDGQTWIIRCRDCGEEREA